MTPTDKDVLFRDLTEIKGALIRIEADNQRIGARCAKLVASHVRMRAASQRLLDLVMGRGRGGRAPGAAEHIAALDELQAASEEEL
jgi:hypothetical protein